MSKFKIIPLLMLMVLFTSLIGFSADILINTGLMTTIPALRFMNVYLMLC